MDGWAHSPAGYPKTVRFRRLRFCARCTKRALIFRAKTFAFHHSAHKSDNNTWRGPRLIDARPLPPRVYFFTPSRLPRYNSATGRGLHAPGLGTLKKFNFFFWSPRVSLPKPIPLLSIYTVTQSWC